MLRKVIIYGLYPVAEQLINKQFPNSGVDQATNAGDVPTETTGSVTDSEKITLSSVNITNGVGINNGMKLYCSLWI